MKKALILAAGQGKRLEELTKNTPKCLLPIRERTLLDFSLSALKTCDISEIILITGFAHEKLKEHITKHWSEKFKFQFIYNDKFAEYNNIYSAYLAKDLWDDETVLLNSDIIYDLEILLAISRKPQDTSYLVIDDSKSLNEEDMKVKTDEKGCIRRVNKKLDIKGSLGEYIGILYLSGKERGEFLKSLETNVKNKNLDLYYEDALDCILNNISVLPFSTNSKPWTEVDTKEDYEVAKKIANELSKHTIQA